MTEKILFLVSHEVKPGGKRSHQIDYVQAYDMTSDILAPYNCMIISGQCDQEFLLSKSDLISSFLNAGKVVMFCGSVVTPWLPGASLFVAETINKHTDYELTIKENTKTKLFEGVNVDHMNYRKGVAGFFARGYHVPTNEVEVLLTIGDDHPVCYVDRVTTRGTILLHSGFNLLTYDTSSMMAGGSSTEVIAEQTVQWCYDEVESLKSVREQNNKRRRIGVVFSGCSNQMRSYKTGEFAKHISRIIPVRDLSSTCLNDLDVLIVPARTNMVAFIPQVEVVQKFADRGGIVVAFGHQDQEWIEVDKYEYRPTNFWWWKEENPHSGLVFTDAGKESDLFKNYITFADATWHQHGVYWPSDGVETLVATDDGASILYIDRQKSKEGKGIWIITTLDPDFHYGHHFMPATEKFLRGFMPWLENGQI